MSYFCYHLIFTTTVQIAAKILSKISTSIHEWNHLLQYIFEDCTQTLCNINSTTLHHSYTVFNVSRLICCQRKIIKKKISKLNRTMDTQSVYTHTTFMITKQQSMKIYWRNVKNWRKNMFGQQNNSVICCKQH